MPRTGKLRLLLGFACCACLAIGQASAAPAEYSPVRGYSVSIGPEANRLIRGGGALDWFDIMFVIGVLLAGRRHARGRQDQRSVRRHSKR